MSSSKLICLVSLLFAVVATGQPTDKIYRMCVPQKYYNDCMTLLKEPKVVGVNMKCTAGRDRMHCLEMINKHEADVLAVEPEDMYVASLIKNDDFKILSEIRTKEDEQAPFRYEGIILVKKNSDIHSLKELRGARSCHTGYGRNVGYKIPITKLKQRNILKVSMDPEMTATERELKALSEFFTKSCLVGTYSPHEDIDRLLKKKYSNLCALCEHPERCNYPDKFSGYDGAIRCLDQGNGEVAFTKVQYIKKYFGLLPDAEAEGNPSDFEYLCEDGSRKPITGQACSWAQRPWTGYITNAAIANNNEELHDLQEHLKRFFENALQSENKDGASHLLINQNAVFHKKADLIGPREYLESASYKDVIERDGSNIRKMRLCVENELEYKKCSVMQQAAYSRDIRPEIECIQETNCVTAVSEGKADMLNIHADGYKAARTQQLMPISYESYGDDNVYVAIVDLETNPKDLVTMPINYDTNNIRARLATAFLNRLLNVDNSQKHTSSNMDIKIVNSKDLQEWSDKKQLLCPDLQMQPITNYHDCNLETYLPRAIFIRSSMTPTEQDTIKHMFTSLSSKFGTHGRFPDVFTLFGEFMPAKHDILFNDDSAKFVTTISNENIKEELFNSLTSN